MATRREFLKQTSAAGLVAATPWHIARAAQTDVPTRASSPTRRTPGIVQTVLGPLDVSKLGFTLTHEHICKNPSQRFGDRANSAARAVDKLKEHWMQASTPSSMSPLLMSGATLASARRSHVSPECKSWRAPASIFLHLNPTMYEHWRRSPNCLSKKSSRESRTRTSKPASSKSRPVLEP